MNINFSDEGKLKKLHEACEKERRRLSNWISSLDKKGLEVDSTLILRHEHITKMTYAAGALYGEVLYPTENT